MLRAETQQRMRKKAEGTLFSAKQKKSPTSISQFILFCTLLGAGLALALSFSVSSLQSVSPTRLAANKMEAEPTLPKAKRRIAPQVVSASEAPTAGSASFFGKQNVPTHVLATATDIELDEPASNGTKKRSRPSSELYVLPHSISTGLSERIY